MKQQTAIEELIEKIETPMKEIIALHEKSGDAKTRIIEKQSEMITFLRNHINALGGLLDEYDEKYDEIVQKNINLKPKNP